MTETETIQSETKLSEDGNKRKGHQIVRSNVAFMAAFILWPCMGFISYLQQTLEPGFGPGYVMFVEVWVLLADRSS